MIDLKEIDTNVFKLVETTTVEEKTTFPYSLFKKSNTRVVEKVLLHFRLEEVTGGYSESVINTIFDDVAKEFLQRIEHDALPLYVLGLQEKHIIFPPPSLFRQPGDDTTYIVCYPIHNIPSEYHQYLPNDVLEKMVYSAMNI